MKIERDKYAAWVLKTIALNTVAPKEALISKNSNTNYASRIVRMLLEKGFIRKKVYKKRKKNRSWSEAYYELTKDGMLVLSRSNEIEWLEELTADDLTGYSSKGGENNSTNTLRYMIQSAEAAIFSEHAGAEIPIIREKNKSGKITRTEYLCFDDEPDENIEEKKFRDLIVGSAGAGEEKLLHTNALKYRKEYRPDTENYIRYLAKKQVKELISEFANDDDPEKYRKSKFTGIIESSDNSVMLFSPYEVGCSWTDWEIRDDLRIMSVWRNNCSILKLKYGKDAGYDFEAGTGAMFVKNHRHFSQLYKDEAGVRKAADVLGGGFKRFCIIPKTNTGAKQLRLIALRDPEDYEYEVAERLIRSGMFTRNTENENTFDLKDRESGVTMLGILLDIRKIQRAEKKCAQSANGTNTYSIVCYRWQVPYYESVVNETVRYVVIPDEYERLLTKGGENGQ